ncbi:polysaccharide biosynthesis C-terminal domain-containing protein, partial [PVC group bacterium]|nr:polysaccharide biosynthesis C-terminal domain-containing protein [PVC group bacterium]
SGRQEALASLYVRASKYVFAATAPLCVFAFVFADEIMLFYMGKPGFELAAVAVRFLCVSYAGLIFSGVARCVARGMGILVPEVRSSLIVLVLNAVLSIVLVIHYGFKGALTGTMVASVVGYVYYMSAFSKRTGFSLQKVVREVYAGAALACLGATGLSWLATQWASSLGLPANRIGYGVVFASAATAFFGAYTLLAFTLRYVTVGEVTSVIGALGLPPLRRKGADENEDANRPE